MDRRVFLTSVAASAAAGAVAFTLDGFAAPAAQAATAGRLPGEVSRIANVRTSSGKLYDNIEVDIRGDRARIFLPQTVRAGSRTAVGAVWFYHAAASSHNALNGGFKYPAELVVDQGAIAICINAGGTQYTNAIAQQAQRNAWTYLSSVFTVRMNFLRATSGGGALACYTYGKKLIPYIRGLYMVNALYDIEWLHRADVEGRSMVGEAYNHDLALLARENPARIPASSWRGANVKVLVSDAEHPDRVTDPAYNGLALVDNIAGVAADTQIVYHALAHKTPSFAHKDMVRTFAVWSGLYG